jgi:hypothetical protein
VCIFRPSYSLCGWMMCGERRKAMRRRLCDESPEQKNRLGQCFCSSSACEMGPHNRRQCHRQHDLTPTNHANSPSVMLLTHFTVTSSAISDAELRNMVDMSWVARPQRCRPRAACFWFKLKVRKASLSPQKFPFINIYNVVRLHKGVGLRTKRCATSIF